MDEEQILEGICYYVTAYECPYCEDVYYSEIDNRDNVVECELCGKEFFARGSM